MSLPLQAETPAGVNLAHSFEQGDFVITVVSDGYISVPGEVVTAGADPADRPAMLQRLPAAIGGVKAYANIPIVQAGSDLVIFDVGGGGEIPGDRGTTR